MPNIEHDIAEVSGQEIYRLLPNTIRTRDPGVIAALCDAIADQRNDLARLMRIIIQSNNPYEAGKFDPTEWGETAEGLAEALELESPEPAPDSYRLHQIKELLVRRLSENLGNRLVGVDEETFRRCIASAIQRYKMRGTAHSLSKASILGSVGESVSQDRWSNLSGSKLSPTPDLYPLIGDNQLPVGDTDYNPNSFDGDPEVYRYDNPSWFPDESGFYIGNMMADNPFVSISGVTSYLSPGIYQLTGGSPSSSASVSVSHLDATITQQASFTTKFAGDWGNLVIVEVRYQNGIFSVIVTGPGTKVKYKTSYHQITHFVHLMIAAYAGIEDTTDPSTVVDLYQATGHMERTMVNEELLPLTRTPLEPSGMAVGVEDTIYYAISKPYRDPIIQSQDGTYWYMVVTGPNSGEWVPWEGPLPGAILYNGSWIAYNGSLLILSQPGSLNQIIQRDEQDGKYYKWVINNDGILQFDEVTGVDNSSLVTFQDWYAWIDGGFLRITVSPPTIGSFDVPSGYYDVPPESLSNWFSEDGIRPVDDWLVSDRPEDIISSDSGSGNMSDQAGFYRETAEVYESTGDIRHRLVGTTGGLYEPYSPYPGDPDIALLTGHGYYVWRDRATNIPYLTQWKGDGTLVSTEIEDVDGPIEGSSAGGVGSQGFLVSPNDQLIDAPHGPLNQIFRPLTRFLYSQSSDVGGNLVIDDGWANGEPLFVGSPYDSLATTDTSGDTGLAWAGSPTFYARKAAEAATPGQGTVSVRLELESISTGLVVKVVHYSTSYDYTVLGDIPVSLGVINSTFTVPGAGSILVLHNGQATGEVFIDWETDPLSGQETLSSDRDCVTVELSP